MTMVSNRMQIDVNDLRIRVLKIEDILAAELGGDLDGRKNEILVQTRRMVFQGLANVENNEYIVPWSQVKELQVLFDDEALKQRLDLMDEDA